MPETETKQSVASLLKRPLLAGALATAAAASVAMPMPVSADTFLKLDGIEGESTDEKHKNEIAVLSFTQSWINTTTVSGAGKGKVQCGAITLMKTIDKSSPVLVKKTIQGTHIASGQLTFRSEGAQPIEYYTIKLNEIFITEVTQIDSADPARIIEKVVLNARKFEYVYTPQSETGEAGGLVKAGYNCATTETT